MASSTSAPTLAGAKFHVDYGGVLQSVKDVFSALNSLGSSVPSGLDVHFSDGRLTVRDVIGLPELPLGLGYVTDIALDLGMSMQLSPQSLEVTAGIGSEERPFHWLVSPLSGTGAIVVGMKDGSPEILIQAGIGLGLAIDIGIAKGSASIVLAAQIAIDGTSIHLKCLLIGQAEVDVLGGLASASLTLTAALGIGLIAGPPAAADFTASVAVGIHISLCWVLHIDFDGSWQYTQTVDLASSSVAT
jgi:hypothetical protein